MAAAEVPPLDGITRIATEEAFAPPDMIARYRQLESRPLEEMELRLAIERVEA